MIMELLTTPEIYLAFFTLTALEIILGIDNIIFISIIVGRAPERLRKRIRLTGLSMAMVMRIVLLSLLAPIMALTNPLFELFSHPFSVRDLILIVGGLFLLAKSTSEIHGSLESESKVKAAYGAGITMLIVQILIIDLVFSIDSIITAVGMTEHVEVMIAAVICAVGVMMFTSGYISNVIEKHPTLKMLALSFLMLIGMALIADGFGLHIPKNYLYFAMGFSLFVEILNIRFRKSQNPVELRKVLSDDEKFVRGEN